MNTITKKLNILYVEDDITINDSMSKLLKLFFNYVKSTFDGKEALEYYTKNLNSLDLIITDIRMPKMNGVELIKEIRKVNENIPIYISSGEFQYEDEILALKVNEWFQKPIRVNEILEKITEDFQINSLKVNYCAHIF